MKHALGDSVAAEPSSTTAPRPYSEFRASFHSLFEQSGMCMANLGPDLRVREANVDFFRQFDRLPKDIYGRGFPGLLHPSVQDKLSREFAHLADRQRGRFTSRVTADRQDGSLLVGELTAIAVYGDNGDVDTVMVLVAPDSSGGEAQTSVHRTALLAPMDARILEGVAAGVSTVKLAASLYLSRGGVEYRVTALLRKLKVSNRPALVSKAHAIGIFNLDSWPPRVLPEYVK